MMVVAVLLVALTLTTHVAYSQNPNPYQCQAPGTCKPPAALHSVVAPVSPRLQWGDSGGYCGALSVQTIALSFGAYISQDVVRKAAPEGGGHGDKRDGYEILHTNIAQALTKLRIRFDYWDFKSHAQPQVDAYRAWLKSHLVRFEPVVWFVMCKGDGHDTYGIAHYDHIEPVWGIYSNRSLVEPATTSVVYPDDVIVHASNWDHNPYYRTMASLNDSLKMDGNCANAVAGWPHDEAYPCLYTQENYGAALLGLEDPGNRSLNVALTLNRWDEPDIKRFEKPAELTITASVSGLKTGSKYTMYKYDSASDMPRTSDYAKTASNQHTFTADGDKYTWEDPKKTSSAASVYYLCVPAE